MVLRTINIQPPVQSLESVAEPPPSIGYDAPSSPQLSARERLQQLRQPIEVDAPPSAKPSGFRPSTIKPLEVDLPRSATPPTLTTSTASTNPPLLRAATPLVRSAAVGGAAAGVISFGVRVWEGQPIEQAAGGAAATTVGTFAGAALGGAIAGPVGAAIGGAVGGALGGAIYDRITRPNSTEGNRAGELAQNKGNPQMRCQGVPFAVIDEIIDVSRYSTGNRSTVGRLFRDESCAIFEGKDYQITFENQTLYPTFLTGTKCLGQAYFTPEEVQRDCRMPWQEDYPGGGPQMKPPADPFKPPDNFLAPLPSPQTNPIPSGLPSALPQRRAPNAAPTLTPAPAPAPTPTPTPAPAPTPTPTPAPAPAPTPAPAPAPTPAPAPAPTPAPAPAPTPAPAPAPTPTPEPTPTPTPAPAPAPTPTPEPTPTPTPAPAPAPTPTPAPAPAPAPAPTPTPTDINKRLEDIEKALAPLALVTLLLQEIQKKQTDLESKIPSQADLENAAAAGTCRTTQPGGCSRKMNDESVEAANGAQGAANEAKKSADKANNKLDELIAAMEAAELTLLKSMDKKLGPQIEGGLSGRLMKTFDKVTDVFDTLKDKFDKLWKQFGLDRAVALLTLAASLHNAAMLSRDLVETLVEVAQTIIQAMQATIPGFLRNPDGEKMDIDLEEMFTNQIEDFLKGALGNENFYNLKAGWLKANRILSSTSNIISSFRGMTNAITDGLDVIGGWVAQGFNGIQREGLVSDKTWPWMNENPHFKFRTIDRFTEKLDNLEEAASSIQQVAQAPIEFVDEATELVEATTELKKTMSEDTAKKLAEEDKKDQESQSPEVSSSDLLPGSTNGT